MTNEERHNKLEACWKGEKCVICRFSLDQSEFNDIVETEAGYAHNDCLKVEGNDRDNHGEDNQIEREQ